ncbi:MAG: hypothetical protein GX465_05975 [Acidobacteria bacterium]|nr:hypothetical protein [Acidobacteriota bacterium]
MATRPVFSPIFEGLQLVQETAIEFVWHPGMAISQRQLNIRSLHEAAAGAGLSPVLEVSTKAQEAIGRSLSAFNLTIALNSGRSVPIEVAFQGSKVFESGGPFEDIMKRTPREAKRDPRLRESGPLREFRYEGCSWVLEPVTAFYDWIYLTALSSRRELVDQLAIYKGFTDIEFNPKKSINCQARSVALFLALDARGLIEIAIESQESFLATLRRFASPTSKPSVQFTLFP